MFNIVNHDVNNSRKLLPFRVSKYRCQKHFTDSKGNNGFSKNFHFLSLIRRVDFWVIISKWENIRFKDLSVEEMNKSFVGKPLLNYERIFLFSESLMNDFSFIHLDYILFVWMSNYSMSFELWEQSHLVERMKCATLIIFSRKFTDQGDCVVNICPQIKELNS